jgi:hypothetical protein
VIGVARTAARDSSKTTGSVPLRVLDERMTQFIADVGVNRR